jgi:hypothetical protein
MVVHNCNPSTWEVEAGRSQLQVQPELHSETVCQNSDNQLKRALPYDPALPLLSIYLKEMISTQEEMPACLHLQQHHSQCLSYQQRCLSINEWIKSM